MNKKDLYYAHILDMYMDKEEDIKNPNNPKVIEAIEYFTKKAEQNMGIGMLWVNYIFADDNADKWEEYAKVKEMLKVYINSYAIKKGKKPEDYELEFINYGRTQFVYVLTDLCDNSKITILAKQPIVEFGKIKQEAECLTELHQYDNNVVAPIDYFAYKDQELFVTPYINQARCIASYGNWGMYVPEPVYRFVDFTPEQERIVNACMIAKLISYYNEEKQEGISACRLGGGDFMLPKGWEETSPTYENTLNNLYFIAARETIKCSLDEYINLIKYEFSNVTNDLNEGDFVINNRGKVAMKMEDIDTGIKMGKKILSSKIINYK